MTKLHSKHIVRKDSGLFEQEVNTTLSTIDVEKLVDVKLSSAAVGNEVVHSALIIYQK